MAQSNREELPLDLTKNWRYRWGDSPVNTDGQLLWLQEEGVENWLESPVQRSGLNTIPQYLWIRVQLPDKKWTNPSLYLPPVFLAFELYIDTERIYHYGEFTPSNDLKFASSVHHLIRLPEDIAGKTLICRIYSPFPKFLGIDINGDPPLIGSQDGLMRGIFQKNIDSVLLGCLFIFSGLFSIGIFLRRYRQRIWFLLSFGWLAITIGLFYALNDSTSSLLTDSPMIRYYTSMFAFIAFPIGMYTFLEQITGKHIVLRWLWILHLAYAVLSMVLDLLNWYLIPQSSDIYSVAFIFSITIAFFVSFKASYGGSKEAKSFTIGFVVFGATGLFDLAAGVGWISSNVWISHWGMLGLLLSLIYILEQRFVENHERLSVYAKELEQKSNELGDYNRTLEQRVSDRTRDLEIKNTELGQTLEELKATQHQLIMQEKMAALGNLVAGVAHEVNTPIGAVNSAADVEARCIGRIHESLEECESIEGLRGDKTFIRASKLLGDSNRVIITAGQRIAKIVQTLKNFARLDEAEERQAADIHECIESTLTLVNHALKNKIEVVKDFGEIPPVNCYPNQLNQVFMNLLVNAAQAIQEKGTVCIRTEDQAGQVQISITDDGQGISPDHISNIFDPGFTTKGVGVGTGLGLSICYKIIKDHQGDIQVESEVGKGTTFKITLPVS